MRKFANECQIIQLLLLKKLQCSELSYTVELRWLVWAWDHESYFQPKVVHAGLASI